ncbi:MAG: DUF5119 domain-containing protein, partial [Bacteroidaceae bacterium]|nr:DUF5119 domain-containing protein [Bacteroidaceae bacterium]
MLMLLVITSCNHDELCYHHPHNARVRVDADWSKFVEEVPTGMTMMVYPQEGSLTQAITQHTNTISHAFFSIPAGKYHSIVYNQSPTEYGSISFRGMENFETAEVYANPTDSRWYVSRGEEDGRVVTEPEWLATDQVKDMVVTQEMVDKTGEDNMAQLAESRGRVENSFLIGEHTPQNIVYTITVTVHIDGIYNLRSARASLSGLAEGFLLGKGKPTANKVTQLMENWTIITDPDDPTKGLIKSQITCFGLPDGHQGKAEENELILSLLLVDNKTKLDFPFQVGDDFEAQIEEDVELKLKLALELELTISTPLPDVKPEGSNDGGFSATVD